MFFTVKEEFYLHFLVTTFFNLVTEKKEFSCQLALSLKINFGSWKLFEIKIS